jgi:riboflavin kinase/FMN adenylyltransferase
MTTNSSISVLTIGAFDGVHLGHRHLIEQTMRRAQARDARSGVITFEPMPLAVLRPESYRGRICSESEKVEMLQETGIDFVRVITFDTALSQLSPEAFLRPLIEQFGAVELVLGDDFALGKGRSGTIPVLADLGRQLGFGVTPVTRVGHNGVIASSTEIRRAIENGNVEHAALLLGRPFRVSGEVVHGAHLGRKIGFPTANFFPPIGIVPVADGIYASEAWLPGADSPYGAMTYVGTRPTVDGADRQIETHILDFEGDLYEQVIVVDVIARVRPDQTFDGLEAMVAQLRRDEITIRSILASHRPQPVSIDPPVAS